MHVYDLHALSLSGPYARGLWRRIQPAAGGMADGEPVLLTLRDGRQVSVLRHDAHTLGIYAPGPESVFAFLDWLSRTAPRAVEQVRAVGVWPQTSTSHPFRRIG